ncbi:MAG: hypothetical protein CHKLHMKO_00467 [Candidatus Argoarchaeum ethanivorans]|uniref:Uncharacterized protein n=1 Tax=Candidatus Argoarchaeum ethanivorans TaxID=2608793 RepID=A0A811TCA2_9EURY|nr:MAG: hypothetical protein CHKLHMKO_00467 [Candidatus Argoarchaeum ethanivorans]
MNKISVNDRIGYLYAKVIEEKTERIAELRGCILIFGPGISHPKYAIRERIKTRTNEMWQNIDCYFPEDFPIQEKDFSTYREFEYYLAKSKYVKLIIILLVRDATGALCEFVDFSNFSAIARKCYVLVCECNGEYVKNTLGVFPNKPTECINDEEMFEKTIEIIEYQIIYAAQHRGIWWTD